MSLPDYPPETHSQLACCLDFIAQSLDEEEIIHLIEPTENPNTWSVAAYDDSDHINSGMVAWSEKEGKLIFCAFDPIRENEAAAEGVSEELAKPWWRPKDAEMMLSFLLGEVREIIAKAVRIGLDSAVKS